jgi:hypothetical protein
MVAHLLSIAMLQRFLAMACVFRSGVASGTDVQDPSLFFCYTAGRWLDNEAEEQRKRYLALISTV